MKNFTRSRLHQNVPDVGCCNWIFKEVVLKEKNKNVNQQILWEKFCLVFNCCRNILYVSGATGEETGVAWLQKMACV